jgi:hypothetical protein
MIIASTERARVVFASNAVVATVAGEEERKRYAVTLFQRTAKRVCIDSIAERMNDTGELVTEQSSL